MALKNSVQPVDKEPLLYGVLTKFMKNNKLKAPKKEVPPPPAPAAAPSKPIK